MVRLSLLKFELVSVAFEPCGYGKLAIEIGTPGANPQPPCGLLEQRCVEVSNDHIVAGLRGLGQDPTVRIKDHGVAGPNLVVIGADPVAEEEKQAAVVRSAGQPTHEPSPSLFSTNFALDRRRIIVPVFPHASVDDAHQVRIPRTAAARLVRRNKDLGAAQSGDADIFDNVDVVTYEEAGAEPMRRIEDRMCVAGTDGRMLEGMKFSVGDECAIGHGHDIGVMKNSVSCSLEQACAKAHPMPDGQIAQPGTAWPVRYGFGEQRKFRYGKVAHKPIPGQAAFGKDNHLDTASGGFPGE